MNGLLESPDFIAALKGSESIRAVAKEYQVSYGFVQKHRKRVRESGGVVSSGTYSPDTGQSMVLSADVAWGYEDWREWLSSTGVDPDTVSFTWGVTTNPSGGFWNKIDKIKPVGGENWEEKYTLSEARELASRIKVSEVTPGEGRSDVVVLADFQIGKTGRRGGTPELISRIEKGRSDVVEWLGGKDNPERILLMDLGDMIEGFESGGNPMFTNDLSLADQLDLYATVLLEFIQDVAEYAPVDVSVVPSNHAAWRRGKQNLGRPDDDFGIFVHKQVQKMCELAGIDVTFHYPDEYDESVLVMAKGTPVGAVHGNQFGQGKAIDWWEGQAFGSQAITQADVLVTGHYHSFGAGVAGINPYTGRERYWLGAPTLDSGSEWYRTIKGRDSNPGIMVFSVDSAGFDLGSLAIL